VKLTAVAAAEKDFRHVRGKPQIAGSVANTRIPPLCSVARPYIRAGRFTDYGEPGFPACQVSVADPIQIVPTVLTKSDISQPVVSPGPAHVFSNALKLYFTRGRPFHWRGCAIKSVYPLAEPKQPPPSGRHQRAG